MHRRVQHRRNPKKRVLLLQKNTSKRIENKPLHSEMSFHANPTDKQRDDVMKDVQELERAVFQHNKHSVELENSIVNDKNSSVDSSKHTNS